MRDRRRLALWIVTAVILLLVAGPMLSSISADGHRDRQTSSGGWGKGRDRGNETTGLTAAWLLGAANLTVALSLLIKGINRFSPIGETAKTALLQFNRSQKKLLMPLHFYLNPLILAVALIHWGLSHCRTTALPECGIVLMSSLVLMGLVIKFKLCPKDMLKLVYRLHSHPAALVTLIVLLVIGHSIMD
ncbi:MAG: hypothetical protein AB9873_06165 [Syntrophobacteraceae bacterium]